MFFNPTGFLGGAEMCLIDLVAALRADRPGWPLRVLLGDDGPLLPTLAGLGVGCDVLPMPSALANAGDEEAEELDEDEEDAGRE